MTAPKYTNRLLNATSPYLLQHAHNPVDWYEWGEEAFERARREDKPILVSVGYSSCHWCHVQASESFENEATAALMNEHFINIKVDREERPDIDNIYMAAVQAMTGSGGWPLHCWLLPDGRPFYAGTYFPPDEKAARYNMPSFNHVLRSLAEAYRTRRDELATTGDRLVERIEQIARSQPPAGAAIPTLAEVLDSAGAVLAQNFDEQHGGFGDAPKFPQPMVLEFLLRAHLRGDERALPMLSLTLRKMAQGGMYDQLGGGFHRYSVDARWLVPHFEKMLYDNALLARLYGEVYQVIGDPLQRRVAEETLDYMVREMRHPAGGFYSSQDADSLAYPGAAHGEEGAFFVWSAEEVRELLGADAALFCQIYDVSRRGNFDFQHSTDESSDQQKSATDTIRAARTNILNLPRDLAQVARASGVSVERLSEVAARGRARLFAARELRPKPFRDEKVLTAWNAMALRAFAVAAMALDRPDYLAVAQHNADFLLRELRRSDGRLLRSWIASSAARPAASGQKPSQVLAFLDDYALLADGLLALHAADGDPRWLREALGLADQLIALFWDEELGGFYDTAADHQRLITRPRDVSDNAAPSGNSAATELLLRLAALTGEDSYRERAERVLGGLATHMARFPTGFGRLLCAADLAAAPIVELAIVGPTAAPATQALVAAALASYRPHLVVARRDPADDTVVALTPLLSERGLVKGQPAAYVCQGFVCQLPVTTPADLVSQLGR